MKTSENIYVLPIDREKVKELVSNQFGYDVYSVQKLALIPFVIETYLITDEFVGWRVSNKPIKIGISINVDSEYEGKPCKAIEFKTIIFDSDEVPYLEETTLAEFTKERRGYNSRISSNESELLRALNKEFEIFENEG